MKILITGGAGFIGSAVVRHIVRNTNHVVVNLDKLTYAGNLQAVAQVADSARYSFERADICDAIALKRILRQHQPDAIMHLAAESHVDRSIDRPNVFMETNILGTYTLLEAARHYWQQLDPVRKAGFRLHHVSTDEVYGDLADSQALFTESTPYAPSSPYSASKASSDHLVRAWHRSYGLPVILSHCSNNYGPWQYPEKLIPVVLTNALAGRPIPLYGQGRQIRDWIYVEDHASALYTVLTHGRIGQTYNIAGGNERHNIDVVHDVCDVLQTLNPARGASYRDLIAHVPDRPGHDERYAMDAGKIRAELGWTPTQTFHTGLVKTVEWFLAQFIAPGGQGTC